MEDTEDTMYSAEDIAESNYWMANDQAPGVDHETVLGAMASYLVNTVDTCREQNTANSRARAKGLEYGESVSAETAVEHFLQLMTTQTVKIDLR